MLRLHLPQQKFFAWSADGKVLYVAMDDGVSRIDAPTWTVTHHVDFGGATGGNVTGVVLTSQGVLAGVRQVIASTPAGPGGLVKFDVRTSRPFEMKHVRSLVILDPANLQVVKQYNGPCLGIAGGAGSSVVVCTPENTLTAKLIDLKTGDVLDDSEKKDGVGEGAKSTKNVRAFEEMVTSPDGKTLFHRESRHPIYSTDISGGKFGATTALDVGEPHGGPQQVGTQSSMYLSHDGKKLAIYQEPKPNEARYAVIDVGAGKTEDHNHPYQAPSSTAFAFAGLNNRPVTNMKEEQNNPTIGFKAQAAPSDLKVTAYDLVLPRRDQRGQMFRIFNPQRLEGAVIAGAPTNDHVLMCLDGDETAWVTLPPE